MRPAAVIFDCDGTLVDSEVLANEVLVECIAELGVELSAEEAHRRFTGHRIAVCVEILARDFALTVPPTFISDARARMEVAFAARLRAVDGAAELVRAVTVPRCVATGGPRDKAIRNLERTGLAPLFGERVFSSYDLDSWKPEPALFLHAAATLGVKPGSCVVVEDSAPGIEAGIAAGMRVVAYRPVAAKSDAGLPPSVAVVRRLIDALPHVAS